MFETLVAWKEAAPAIGASIALLSAAVALGVFIYTRGANRRRATLDMVMKTLLDDDVQRKYGDFKKLVRRDKDPADAFKLESLVDGTSANHDDRETILNQLNIYELTALGIKRRIFEEKFYKRWFHNQFMKDYENARPFIAAVQKRKASIYCEMSRLYTNWSKTGHPMSHPGRFKMAYWGLTRQSDKINHAIESTKAK